MKKLLWTVALVGVAAIAFQVLARPSEQESSGDWLVSTFNHQALALGKHDDPFTFFVGGHLYGAPENGASSFPSGSLLANIDRLNSTSAEFFMSLGDAIRQTTPRHADGFQRGFAERLTMPLFNSVGNHDVSNRKFYESRYGAVSFFSFVYGHVLFVCLDSELDVGRISGEQLEFLREQLEEGANDDDLHTIMLFSHKLIWATEREDFAIVYTRLNSKRGYVEDGSFGRDVLPLVRQAAASKRVVWMSGDIGIKHSLPLFHQREPDLDLTWVATGLGDTQDDALLLVRVNEQGIAFKPIRLDGKPSQPLESFDAAYWREHFKK